MAAPKGNQFWKIRSEHGRKKLFESADLLWEAAKEYFQWCDENPWKATETTTKKSDQGTEKTEKVKPTPRPYSLDGFRLYVGASSSWLRLFKKTASKDFLSVIEEVEEIVRQNQIEGATVGTYNANIVSRLNNLEEKTANRNLNLDSKPLSPKEAKEINDQLDKEY